MCSAHAEINDLRSQREKPGGDRSRRRRRRRQEASMKKKKGRHRQKNRSDSHISRRQRRHEAGHHHPSVRLGRLDELRGHGDLELRENRKGEEREREKERSRLLLFFGDQRAKSAGKERLCPKTFFFFSLSPPPLSPFAPKEALSFFQQKAWPLPPSLPAPSPPLPRRSW